MLNLVWSTSKYKSGTWIVCFLVIEKLGDCDLQTATLALFTSYSFLINILPCTMYQDRFLYKQPANQTKKYVQLTDELTTCWRCKKKSFYRLSTRNTIICKFWPTNCSWVSCPVSSSILLIVPYETQYLAISLPDSAN